MLLRTTLAMLATALIAFGASKLEGTWTLDPAQSKTSGIAKMKEGTTTYTTEGTGWRYEAKGTREDGQSASTTFTYVKDGEDIKLDGSAFGDAIVMTNGNGDVASGVFKRNGKAIGKVKRTISADGKTMTVTGNSVTADGKKVTYTSVYHKQ